MKKTLSLRIAVSFFAVLLSTLFLCAPAANAQGIGIPAPLYRFFMPNTNYRVFLTTDFQEGLNLGYLYWDTIGTIVLPPQPGWIPNDGQGLAPMYRWRVAHQSGTNYYYSGGLWPDLLANPDISLEGLKGYALIPLASAGGPGLYLHLWYSDEHGYYYASNGIATIPPPHPPGSYTWQGVAGRLPQPYTIPIFNCVPQLGCYQFHPPSPPPSSTTCDEVQIQSCSNNGGTWNPTNCSCTYPPPDPCRQNELTTKGKDLGGKESSSRTDMQCRETVPF